jgi:hypothetical protein
MNAKRAWESATHDGARIQCVQLQAGTQWLHASAYVEVGAAWCRVDMRGRTATEYPDSPAAWRAYCADVARVFLPVEVTA